MLYDGHCYITWCIDFQNYYIFIVHLPYLIQYGIFDVEKLLRFYVVRFYQYNPLCSLYFVLCLTRPALLPAFKIIQSFFLPALLWFCFLHKSFKSSGIYFDVKSE